MVGAAALPAAVTFIAWSTGDAADISCWGLEAIPDTKAGTRTRAACLVPTCRVSPAVAVLPGSRPCSSHKRNSYTKTEYVVEASSSRLATRESPCSRVARREYAKSRMQGYQQSFCVLIVLSDNVFRGNA